MHQQRLALFTDAFDHISRSIDAIYKELTRSDVHPLGGMAYLSLESPDDPFNGGIKYTAMPPSKRFREMEQLSGGEKTVAALALLFAVHSHRPSPFFILDEIDAALDASNIARVAQYIRQRSRGQWDGCFQVRGGGRLLRDKPVVFLGSRLAASHAVRYVSAMILQGGTPAASPRLCCHPRMCPFLPQHHGATHRSLPAPLLPRPSSSLSRTCSSTRPTPSSASPRTWNSSPAECSRSTSRPSWTHEGVGTGTRGSETAGLRRARRRGRSQVDCASRSGQASTTSR